MVLGDIATVRSGDKGDTAQICVIARNREDFRKLADEVTCDRVRSHLSRLPIDRATRFEVPGLFALNFVLEGALRGGVTRSLALDPHGKTLGLQLLDMIIDAGVRGTAADEKEAP